MHEKWLAGLVHMIDWQMSDSELEISPGITLSRTEASDIWKLYEDVCRQGAIDDGEPFAYALYISIEPSESNPYFMDFGDPYSLFDRVCNIIAIVTAQPIAMCRVFWSSDNFKTYDDTHLVYTYGLQTEFLLDSNVSLNDINRVEMCMAWQTAQTLWEKNKSQGRLVNALTYFYYSWRSQYLEQTCINLAIVIEVLFAPHSQSEVSHQISFNVSRFLGTTPDERARIYRLIKKFYSVRSRIVHGGIPDQDAIIDITVEVFQLCASILKAILLDKDLAVTFDSNKLRNDMLSKFIFES